MLETTLIMTLTLFILMAMLSLGFLFYQQSMLITVATETATEVASNYKLSAESNNSGEKELKLYRTTFALNQMKQLTKQRAESYVQSRAPMTTLGFDTEVEVSECDVVMDSIGRLHTEVTVTMECDFFMSGALKYFGIIDDDMKFVATGRAECLDLTAYAGHVHFLEYVGQKVEELDQHGVLGKIAQIVQDIKDIGDVIGG